VQRHTRGGAQFVFATSLEEFMDWLFDKDKTRLRTKRTVFK